MSDPGERDRPESRDAAGGLRTRSSDEHGSPRVVHSAALLDGRSQLAILHNETVYFLRQTRFGKLILTK